MRIKFPPALSWLVSALTPIFLLGLGVRALLTPVFLQIEYNMPYFPPDGFGLTKEDRLRWAPYAVEYLVNNEDISYLSHLSFDDGYPLYNGRELSHMADVKRVTQSALRAWYAAIAALILLGVWSWFGEGKQIFVKGLRRGGQWMIGFAAALGVIVGISLFVDIQMFLGFFTLFHELFFEGGSWVFYWSDTLIRLFPPRFWQDAFLWASVIALGGGFALAFGLKERTV